MGDWCDCGPRECTGKFPRDQCRVNSRHTVRLQQKIERLTAEVKSAFFAGCDYGSKYAGDQYLGTPERQRGFDQWNRDSGSQECHWMDRFQTGDHGQRYAVTYINPATDKRCPFGWADDREVVDKMVDSIEKHPAWHSPEVEDRDGDKQ